MEIQMNTEIPEIAAQTENRNKMFFSFARERNDKYSYVFVLAKNIVFFFSLYVSIFRFVPTPWLMGTADLTPHMTFPRKPDEPTGRRLLACVSAASPFMNTHKLLCPILFDRWKHVPRTFLPNSISLQGAFFEGSIHMMPCKEEGQWWLEPGQKKWHCSRGANS